MALQEDCILWNLELSENDFAFEGKQTILETKGFELFEHFCIPTKAEVIPSRFITMLSILRDKPISTIEERKELLLESVKEKMRQYVTLVISDRTRSRYVID